MRREEHCKECLEELGEEFDEVHAWLDGLAGKWWPWMGHRQFRHHTEGIEEVRRMWGYEAAEAARLHIISDEGHVPTPEEIRKKYGDPPYPPLTS